MLYPIFALSTIGRMSVFPGFFGPISPISKKFIANIATRKYCAKSPKSPQICSISPQIRQFFGQKNANLVQISLFFIEKLPIFPKFSKIADFYILATKMFKYRWRCQRNSVAKLGPNFADLAINRQTWEH